MDDALDRADAPQDDIGAVDVPPPDEAAALFDSGISPGKLRRIGGDQPSPPGGGRRRRNSINVNTSDALIKRLNLLKDPQILAALESLWLSANSDTSDAIIDHAEYLVMHRKITLALAPSTTPKAAAEQAEKDWVRDSEGKLGLDRDRFYWTWFELADVYTKTIEADEYVRFLERMQALIVKEDEKTGLTIWQDDRAVIEGHFERQRKRGKGHDVDNSMPVVMAQWHLVLKAERDAQRAKAAEERLAAELASEALVPRRGSMAAGPRRGSCSGGAVAAAAAAATASMATRRRSMDAAAPGGRRGSMGGGGRRGSTSGAAVAAAAAAATASMNMGRRRSVDGSGYSASENAKRLCVSQSVLEAAGMPIVGPSAGANGIPATDIAVTVVAAHAPLPTEAVPSALSAPYDTEAAASAEAAASGDAAAAVEVADRPDAAGGGGAPPEVNVWGRGDGSPGFSFSVNQTPSAKLPSPERHIPTGHGVPGNSPSGSRPSSPEGALPAAPPGSPDIPGWMAGRRLDGLARAAAEAGKSGAPPAYGAATHRAAPVLEPASDAGGGSTGEEESSAAPADEKLPIYEELTIGERLEKVAREARRARRASFDPDRIAAEAAEAARAAAIFEPRRRGSISANLGEYDKPLAMGGPRSPSPSPPPASQARRGSIDPTRGFTMSMTPRFPEQGAAPASDVRDVAPPVPTKNGGLRGKPPPKTETAGGIIVSSIDHSTGHAFSSTPRWPSSAKGIGIKGTSTPGPGAYESKTAPGAVCPGAPISRGAPGPAPRTVGGGFSRESRFGRAVNPGRESTPGPGAYAPPTPIEVKPLGRPNSAPGPRTRKARALGKAARALVALKSGGAAAPAAEPDAERGPTARELLGGLTPTPWEGEGDDDGAAAPAGADADAASSTRADGAATPSPARPTSAPAGRHVVIGSAAPMQTAEEEAAAAAAALRADVQAELTSPQKLRIVEEHAHTRSRVVQALACAHEDRHKLQALRVVLEAGMREWWALPLVLASKCSGRVWEDVTLRAFAEVLHAATVSARAAAPAVASDALAAMAHALRPHAMLGTLVALIANDAPAMREAALRCSPTELQPASATAVIASDAATASDGIIPKGLGFTPLNLALWWAVLRDVELESPLGAASDGALGISARGLLTKGPSASAGGAAYAAAVFSPRRAPPRPRMDRKGPPMSQSHRARAASARGARTAGGGGGGGVSVGSGRAAGGYSVIHAYLPRNRNAPQMRQAPTKPQVLYLDRGDRAPHYQGPKMAFNAGSLAPRPAHGYYSGVAPHREAPVFRR